jgi:hypothetical protein
MKKTANKKVAGGETGNSSTAITVAIIALVGSLIVALSSNPVLNDWLKNRLATPTVAQEIPNITVAPTQALWEPQLSATPINPGEATSYLERVYTMWTIAGYLGDYPKTLSAFHSLLALNGDTDPTGTMRAWIEESKQMVVEAIPGTSVSDYKYLEFNLSLNYESIGLEESYFVLWDHVSHDPVIDNKPSNMAAIRLALIASVGEERQSQLIGEWNNLIK